MTDQQLNERLAGALGFEIISTNGLVVNPDTTDRSERASFIDFSPATSVDALRKWVLPEIVRRGLWLRFVLRAMESDSQTVPKGFCETYGAGLYLGLASDPAVLAAAALQVLEDDNA